MWGYKQRGQQQLRLDETKGIPTLSSTQGSFQAWKNEGMDTHSLPGKPAPVLDYCRVKIFILMSRLMDGEKVVMAAEFLTRVQMLLIIFHRSAPIKQ